MRRKIKPEFLLIAILFVLSGLAGLIYQVVWFKHLSYFLGNTTYSQVIVLATFMGGLAIGSWWWGKRADRSRDALKLFAWLEVAIAIYCFLYFPIFEFVKEMFVALVKSQGWRSDSTMVLVLKLFVSAFTMLLPAILMGGTLPVLVRYLSDRITEVGKNVSILYFINSLGAVLGTVLAGFYLLQTIGLRATVYVGATADLLVGLVFLIITYGIFKKRVELFPKKVKVKNEKVSREKEAKYIITRKQYNIVIIIAGVSGMCAMIYEVVWLRLLIPILSSTTYSFTLILAVFITGITLGSLLVYFILPKLKKPFLFLGLCQLFIVLSILLTLPFYEKIPYLIWSSIGDDMKSLEGYQYYLRTQLYYSSLIMIIPTVFMGMSLPIASRLAVKNVEKSGSNVGRVFSINTLGTVIGSILAGLFLIPFIGIKSTIELCLILNLVLAFLVIFYPQLLKPKSKVLVLVIVIFSGIYYLLNVSTERWAYSIMMSEVPRSINRSEPPETFEKFYNQERIKHDSILYYDEGVGGTIIVGKKDKKVYLYTNGKRDAHSVSDLRTQTMLGHIPLILHSDPDTVMVVGLGAGTTIGSVLIDERVQYAEVAEISSEVIDASKHFEHVNNKPLQDERLRVIKDDGITALRLSLYKYDIIISQPSNPWSAGVGNLFTKEFFEDCSSKLNPGGYMAQWFSLYEMDNETLKLIIRTISTEFKYISLWQINSYDILLLCSNEQFDFDLNNIEENFNVRLHKFENLNMNIFEVFLSQELMSYSFDLENFSGEGPLNTENLPLLEYWAPKSYFLNTYPDEVVNLDERLSKNNSNLLLNKYLGDKELSKESSFNIGMYQTNFGSYKYGIGLGDKNPMIYMFWAKNETKKENYTKALKYLDMAISANDTLSDAYQQKAVIAARLGQKEKAIEEISKAIKSAPELTDYYIQRSQLYTSNKNLTKAVLDLEKASELNPERIDLYFQIADLYGQMDQYSKVITVLNLVEQHAKNKAEFYFKRGLAHFLTNNYENAISDLNRAVSLEPGFGQAYLLGARVYLKNNNYSEGCNWLHLAKNNGGQQVDKLIKHYCE